MEKKIYNLIICLLISVIIIICILIYAVFNSGKDGSTGNGGKNTELTQTDIDDPVDSDGYKVHVSENGYSVRYPAKYTAKHMAKAVDFILTDDDSGSSVNVVTAKNDGTLKQMSEEDFIASVAESGMSIHMQSYENITLGGTPATVAKYVYNGNNVTQAIVILEDFGYNITITESPAISEETSSEFEEILNSFTVG